MQHDHILLLIDTYLERLQKVRQLLSEVAASPDVTLTTTPETTTRLKGLSAASAEQQVAKVRVIEPGDMSPKKRTAMRKKKTVGMEPLFAAPTTETAEAASAVEVMIANEPAAPEPISFEVAPQQDIPVMQAVSSAPAEPQQNLSAKAEAIAPAPVAIKPMQVRAHLQRAIRVVKRRSPIASSSALVGAVPAGPVFISADKVRQQKSERQPEVTKSRNASEAQAAKPLTAELLAQRWIQSPAW